MSVKYFLRLLLTFFIILWILSQTTGQVPTDDYNYHVPLPEDELYFENHDEGLNQFKSTGDQKDTYYEVKIPCYGSDKDMPISTSFLKITCASWMDYEWTSTGDEKYSYVRYKFFEEYRKKENPLMTVDISHKLGTDYDGYPVSIVDYMIKFKNYSYPNVLSIHLNRQTRTNFKSMFIGEILKMFIEQEKRIEKTIEYSITTMCDSSNMEGSEGCWELVHGKSKKSYFLTTNDIPTDVMEKDYISIYIANATGRYFTDEKHEMNKSLIENKQFEMHTTTPIAKICKNADDTSFELFVLASVWLHFSFVFVILLAKTVRRRRDKSTKKPYIDQLTVV